MFDWNDQDQVGDTIWGNFNESEDHIVPYPKGAEESTLFTFEEYSKKQKAEEVIPIVRSVEETSGDKNEASKPNAQSISNFNGNDELSASRLDMDIWPELPSLNAALSNGYDAQNDRESLEAGLLNDSNEASTSTKVRVQLGGALELFGGEPQGKDGDSFLDCDWTGIGDFDDLDKIFSRNNDSIFGNGIVGSTDEFFSPSTDVIDATAQSIPVPDIPAASKAKSPDQDCSSLQFEHDDGEVPSEEKKTEVKTEQPENQNNLTSEYSALSYQSSEKVDRQKKPATVQRSKNKAAENVKSSWSTNIPRQVVDGKFHPSITNSAQVFQSPSISPRTHATHAAPVCQPGSGQYMFSGYGYPPYSVAAVAHLPCIHAEQKQRKPVSTGQKNWPDSLKHSESVNKQPDVIKTHGMTPRAKIEKLRRRHQMQAIVAIQQQRQQLSHQISGTESSVSQGGLQKNRSQEAIGSTNGYDENPYKIPFAESFIEIDERHMMDDHAFAETIYNQLQDALDKLDIRVRLRMRDSLLRLAKSATERKNACDRSCTNRSDGDEDDVPTNDDINNQDRSSRLSDGETQTNPIDRTVAHLLFHRPSESCLRTMKDEVPRSPVSSSPVSKPYLKISSNIPEEQPGN